MSYISQKAVVATLQWHRLTSYDILKYKSALLQHALLLAFLGWQWQRSYEISFVIPQTVVQGEKRHHQRANQVHYTDKTDNTSHT